MSVKRKFSPEEVEKLRANPYTERVTAEQISFTLAFKEEFWRLSVEGCTGNIAFRKLGYDPEARGFIGRFLAASNRLDRRLRRGRVQRAGKISRRWAFRHLSNKA